MPTLFLVFNHRLTAEQQADARDTLGVNEFVYLPEDLQNFWSQVPPDGKLDTDALSKIAAWLYAKATSNDYILIQGDFGATFWLVNWCFSQKLRALYATTKREVKEIHYGNGKVEKKLIFKHVGYRTYKRFK